MPHMQMWRVWTHPPLNTAHPLLDSTSDTVISAKCHNPVNWNKAILLTLCVVRMFNLAPNPPLLNFYFCGHNLASLRIQMRGHHTRPSNKPPSLLQLLLHGQISEASFITRSTYPSVLTSNGISQKNLSLLPICTLCSGTKDFSL
jgi:hypothetical protein